MKIQFVLNSTVYYDSLQLSPLVLLVFPQATSYHQLKLLSPPPCPKEYKYNV